MTNNYLTTIERYGRPEKVFDMARFAADLAAAMGGEVLERDADRIGNDRDTIEVDGVRVWLTVKGWGAGAGEKVHAWAVTPNGLAYADRPYGGDFKMPDAYVNPGRPMAALAKDIRRRVIEPAKPVLARWRAHAVEVGKRINGLAERAAWLRKMGLEVRLDEGASRNGTFHGFGLYGEFYADSISMRNVSLDHATFARVLKVIGEEN